MSKAHKIFYQITDRKNPWALELYVYYDYPKIFDMDGAVYHESLDRNVRSFYFTIYDNYAAAFKKMWNEIMVKLADKYDDFIVSDADYHIVFSDFESLLETYIGVK